jgi:glycine/D-amino acid oxidase-like deaminating enzyme
MTNSHCDVAIIGGAVMGSATAYFLSENPDFAGRILVIEKDRTYQHAASSRSTSGFRQQFSTPVNVALARYSAEFIKAADDALSVPGESAGVPVNEAGYLYLGRAHQVAAFERNNAIQRGLGVDVALLDTAELAARFPWLNLDDVAIGSLGSSGEGWFDGYLLMHAFRRRALHNGVDYRYADVVDLEATGDGGFDIALADGDRVKGGAVVVTAGTGAAKIAAMIGIEVPVRPLKQSVFAFASPWKQDGMPYVFTPDGVFVRPDGSDYIAGIGIEDDAPFEDAPDFEPDHGLFEDQLWPKLAGRVAGFENLRLKSAWAGHYDMSLFDHNPFIGAVDGAPKFFLATGFSGHGIMQSPGIGRGLSELIVHGRYTTLDLSDLAFSRIVEGRRLRETIQY